MLVEDVMTEPVLTVDADTELLEAVDLMFEGGVGSVVVTTGSPPRKVGIVTDVDLKRIISEFDWSPSPAGRVRRAVTALFGSQRDGPFTDSTVRDVMTRPLVTVQPDLALSDATKRMREEGVSHLVVTEKMEVEGIVTPWDVAMAHNDVVREVRRTNAKRPNWKR